MKYLFFILLLQVLTSCMKKGTIAFTEEHVSCIGVELDGSQTLLSHGRGRNRWDAIQQAEKNAVREVIFNGICDGLGCECRPIIGGVNSQIMRSPYFNDFFEDNGSFSSFVNHNDERLGQRIFRRIYRSASGVAINAVVTVDRISLIEKLRNDQIIN